MGTRRNKILQTIPLRPQQQQPMARVPRQFLRRPVKSRNNIQQPRTRTPNRVQRMPSPLKAKSNILPQTSHRPHAVVKAQQKPQTLARTANRSPPRTAVAGVKGRVRQQVATHPQKPAIRPAKTAAKAQVLHAPNPHPRPATGSVRSPAKLPHRYET